MPRRRLLLIVLLLLQSFCCCYFIADIAVDFVFPHAADPTTGVLAFVDSEVFEMIVIAALLSGVAFTGVELLKLMHRNQELNDQIRIASGAFSDLLHERFDHWGLTKAERDVALLAIKGFSISEIAEFRSTKQGTIKAQCAALYRKAGVKGRLELLSLFIDELMGETLLSAEHQQDATLGGVCI